MKTVFLPVFAALLAAVILPAEIFAQSTNVRAPNRNQSARFKSAIFKGSGNLIQSNATASFIGGGQSNTVATRATNGVVVGGFGNAVASVFGTVAGGGSNTNAGSASFIGGGFGNLIPSNSTASTIGGGFGNTVAATNLPENSGVPEQQRSAGATIAGGSGNTASGFKSTVGGGEDNLVSGGHSVIAGGRANTLEAGESVLVGGFENIVTNAAQSVLVGGFQNTIAESANAFSIFHAFIGGGERNTITNTADGAVISGGTRNTNSGTNATIPGGIFNEAKGNNSFAAGAQAKAEHNGAFVWGGDASTLTISTNNNSFTVRATGGVRFITSTAGGTGLTNANTNGVILNPGSGSWTSLSDRNAKENFTTINGREVLAKVSTMPVMTWNYRAQHKTIRHIGPTAQDFKEAFGLGESDTGITTVDADGVALAAIQGLVEELKERDEAIDELKTELRALRDEVRGNLPPAP